MKACEGAITEQIPAAKEATSKRVAAEGIAAVGDVAQGTATELVPDEAGKMARTIGTMRESRAS